MQKELFKPVKQKVKWVPVKTYGTGKVALVPVFPQKFDTAHLADVHRFTDKINNTDK